MMSAQKEAEQRQADWATGRTLERKDVEIDNLRAEVQRLRGIIRQYGRSHWICTYHDLREVCDTCRCKWKEERLAELASGK